MSLYVYVLFIHESIDLYIITYVHGFIYEYIDT